MGLTQYSIQISDNSVRGLGLEESIFSDFQSETNRYLEDIFPRSGGKYKQTKCFIQINVFDL